MKVSSIIVGSLLAAASVSGIAWTCTVNGISKAIKLPLHTTDGAYKVPWTGGAESWIWDSFADGCCIVFCRGSKDVGRYCSSAYNMESSAGNHQSRDWMWRCNVELLKRSNAIVVATVEVFRFGLFYPNPRIPFVNRKG
ncbi:uncharacterized protein Z518_05450 [Rhinocladiella mackenziei CBS 650.93]|uniref:Uncharacterized protein n=1 Tax=Rhinocladiella mackenziei CBS 650.93 TaxID=1442369 RepID=A0A0D2J6B6_9EURO|nr:uncharacterized protein Z518_05450 [Rhinocladiella mackenziei CBS 650.93]KIX04580.1 hypothetical protein Z518_05450 [Rhinocladiella mackenziei CBS 650.93]